MTEASGSGPVIVGVSARRPGPLRLAALAIALLLLWLVGYPLLITFFEALSLPGGGLGVDRFIEFSQRPDEWMALWRSVWISLASVALSALVGVPLALFFDRYEFPGRRILGVLVALPVALPPLVGVIAFLFLFGESGFLARGVAALFGLEDSPWRLSGPGAILLVHTYSMYVYFYLFVRAALARMDGAVLEAAASLGADSARTLWRVVLPLLRPALVGASLLTFMTSLASFSAPYVFGAGFRVMTTQIVASKLQGDLGMAQVESVTLAIVALIALVLLQLGGAARGIAASRGAAPRPRRNLSTSAKTIAAFFGWLISIFLLLPHATLLLISFVPPATWTNEALPPVLSWSNYVNLAVQAERWRPVVNSLWMAAVATLAAVILGLAAARFAARLRQASKSRGDRGLGKVLEGLLALPWAIPGTVFAVALAFTFGVDKPWFGRFVWVGTPLILPLAYLVRSLPLTGRSAIAGVAQLDPALEEASASLGAGRWRTMRRIVLPRLRPALAAGAGLAFITGLGDFVTSVVLYTYETRPISIEILSSLRLQELGAAAVYGVLLMVVSAGAFLVWGREEAV